MNSPIERQANYFHNNINIFFFLIFLLLCSVQSLLKLLLTLGYISISQLFGEETKIFLPFPKTYLCEARFYLICLLTQAVYYNILNAEAAMRTQLSSFKREIKDIFKNVKQCPLLSNILFWETIRCQKTLFLLTYNGSIVIFKRLNTYLIFSVLNFEMIKSIDISYINGSS